MLYYLMLSCCFYTCCIGKRLRKTLNITGGSIDDLLSHLMCCCCALVQEVREVEFRGASYGKYVHFTYRLQYQFFEFLDLIFDVDTKKKRKVMIPPSPQYMEE
ncbi:unnamed protein product [Cochlearia groenlandica]